MAAPLIYFYRCLPLSFQGGKGIFIAFSEDTAIFL